MSETEKNLRGLLGMMAQIDPASDKNNSTPRELCATCDGRCADGEDCSTGENNSSIPSAICYKDAGHCGAGGYCADCPSTQSAEPAQGGLTDDEILGMDCLRFTSEGDEHAIASSSVIEFARAIERAILARHTAPKQAVGCPDLSDDTPPDLLQRNIRAQVARRAAGECQHDYQLDFASSIKFCSKCGSVERKEAERAAVPEGFALVLVERGYDERVKQIIAFNQCKGDLDDKLEAAHKAMLAAAPAAPVAQEGEEGMPVSQEPKYGIRDNRLYNRASGEFIPADEPVFIFHARDNYAARAISAYARMLDFHSPHRLAVEARANDFATFAALHPERMKDPDTAAVQQTSAQVDASPCACWPGRMCNRSADCAAALAQKNGNAVNGESK